VRLNALCGCGQPFDRCPLWSEVMADPAVARFRAVAQRLERFPRAANRRLPLALVDQRLAGRMRADAALYRDQLTALYRAVARVSGASVILDSSKTPSHAYVLARMPEVDVRVAHLLRDPRAVAHSWHRQVTRVDLGSDRPREMTRTTVARGALKWAYSNALIDISSRPLHGEAVLRMRYEDVVADPWSTLSALTALAGQPEAVVPMSDDGTVDLHPTHTVWGNPNRLKTGPMRLRRDDAWEASMPLTERLTVTAITWPLLLRYGYPLVSGRDATS
jgi:hypothetical protein